MARRLFTVESGIQIVDENGQTGPVILKGTGAPGGSGGAQDDASIGSIFLNDSGGLYKKTLDNNLASD